jgi:hypothetical protein
VEADIAEWRAFIGSSVDGSDIDELEAHLRDQIAELTAAGLAPDEAFLVAVKRMGAIDAVSREFAREYSGRLWRQLVGSHHDVSPSPDRSWRQALGFAGAAAVATLLARIGTQMLGNPSWLLRNAAFLALPFLAGYFAQRRRLSPRQILGTALAFVVAAGLVNLYPFAEGSSTELLAAAHLPVALWFVVAYPYMGGRIGSGEQRMDYVRFTGEWFIYYVLIALGGGVLMALTTLILEPTGIGNPERVVEWVLPSGAAGAVIVAAWLVESKQRVVENMAPVLTMLFTPLFAVMLAGATVAYAATGFGGAFNRELLGVFDALLVVVLGLVLYGMSARDPFAPPGWMDRIQLVAVVAALALDVVVLGAMLARISELGFTPNRAAALGLNLVLAVNLAGAAWRSLRFLRGRATFHHVESWQTSHLPVLAGWATAVVVVLPPLFGFG